MKFERLYGHTDGVNCLTYWNTIAASGSDDHTVRLWDLRNENCFEPTVLETDDVLVDLVFYFVEFRLFET